MKTLIFCVIILLILTGCMNESTAIIPNENKWVEITDTIHLNNISGMSAVYSTWGNINGLIVRSNSEYVELALMVDTTDQLYKPIQLPSAPIDFSLNSMVGLKYSVTIDDTLKSSIFVNDSLKKYIYFVHNISDPNALKEKRGITYQNWVRIPRFHDGYTVQFDTSVVKFNHP